MNSNATAHVDSAIGAELDAMRTIGEAMSVLDPGARARVIEWVAGRFGISRGTASRDTQALASGPQAVSDDEVVGEIPGIARMIGDRFEMTVRDLKAKSTIDAAIRLAHVVIYAHEKLAGKKSVSSRKVLLPILKEWRAYDGNTRPALANHKGIHRNGDELSLDALSRQEAQDYIDQILDDSIRGTWNPKGRSTRKAAKKDAPVAVLEESSNGPE